jgi:hypothetical protein
MAESLSVEEPLGNPVELRYGEVETSGSDLVGQSMYRAEELAAEAAADRRPCSRARRQRSALSLVSITVIETGGARAQRPDHYVRVTK